MAPVSPQGVLRLIKPFQHHLPLALDAPPPLGAKELAEPVCAQPQQTQLATALKELTQAAMGTEDPVQTILGLLYKPLSAQGTYLLAFPLRKLGRQDRRPIIQTSLNDV